MNEKTRRVALLGVLFALANFLLFFGGDFIALARREWMYYKNRRNWRRGGW